MTAQSKKITLTIAANYGCRWGILQAVQAWHASNPDTPVSELTETALQQYPSMPYAPEPDLHIRNGGEARISNLMLWQSAYTELHLTQVLWLNFDSELLDKALACFAQQDRRFSSADATPLINQLATG